MCRSTRVWVGGQGAVGRGTKCCHWLCSSVLWGHASQSLGLPAWIQLWVSWPGNDTADKGHERLSGCPEVKDPAKVPGKDKFKEASPLEPTSHSSAHSPLAPQHRNTLQR